MRPHPRGHWRRAVWRVRWDKGGARACGSQALPAAGRWHARTAQHLAKIFPPNCPGAHLAYDTLVMDVG